MTLMTMKNRIGARIDRPTMKPLLESRPEAKAVAFGAKGTQQNEASAGIPLTEFIRQPSAGGGG
jgi:hypothetical protein